jgi:hypothetical protein
MGSDWTRRATNVSTFDEGRSSHWASSASTRSGELEAASASNSSVASATETGRAQMISTCRRRRGRPPSEDLVTPRRSMPEGGAVDGDRRM